MEVKNVIFMKKNISSFLSQISLVLALPFFLGSCASLTGGGSEHLLIEKVHPIKTKDDFSPAPLYILFNHNAQGETHPCGCRHYPLGGVTPIEGLLHHLRHDIGLTPPGLSSPLIALNQQLPDYQQQVLASKEVRSPQTSEVLFFDSGDMLFPLTFIAEDQKVSQKFQATWLIKKMKSLGLNAVTPGDQDFAAGWDFYWQLIGETQLPVLIANFIPQNLLNTKSASISLDAETAQEIQSSYKHVMKWHRRSMIINYGPHRIFVTGVIDPELYTDVLPEFILQSLYSPSKAIQSIVQDWQSKHDLDLKNPFHRVIILSHQGMKKDIQLAKEFPFIHRIIGAHGQELTQTPEKQGQTEIYQVKSQNHYLGLLTLSPLESKLKDHFNLLTIRSEWGNSLPEELKQASIRDLEKFKTALQRAQKSETWNKTPPTISTSNSSVTSMLSQVNDTEGDKEQVEEEEVLHQIAQDEHYSPSFKSCLECHATQASFWGQTSHSVAFTTLIREKAENNPQCVGCHSLGNYENSVHRNTSTLVEFNPAASVKINQRYWRELSAIFKEMPPVRTLTKVSENKGEWTIQKAHQQWQQFDEKFAEKTHHKVEHQYANVQCLNCHDQSFEHPFDAGPLNLTIKEKVVRKEKILFNCLQCHTPEQSPEWYVDGEKANIQLQQFKKRRVSPEFIKKQLSEPVLKKFYPQVSCPEIK